MRREGDLDRFLKVLINYGYDEEYKLVKEFEKK